MQTLFSILNYEAGYTKLKAACFMENRVDEKIKFSEHNERRQAREPASSLFTHTF